MFSILNILNKSVRNAEVVPDTEYWSTPGPLSQAAQVSVTLTGKGTTPSVTPAALFTVVCSAQG